VFTFSLLPYEYNSITISYWISALRFDWDGDQQIVQNVDQKVLVTILIVRER
jgi:hypothetical protein